MMVLMAISNEPDPIELPDDDVNPDEADPLPDEEPVKTDPVPEEPA